MNITNSRVIGTGNPSPTFNILLTIRFSTQTSAARTCRGASPHTINDSCKANPLRDNKLISNANKRSKAEHGANLPRGFPAYFPLRDIAFVSIAFTAEMAEAFAS